MHCVKSVRIRSFFWSVLSVFSQIRKNTDQKNSEYTHAMMSSGFQDTGNVSQRIYYCLLDTWKTQMFVLSIFTSNNFVYQRLIPNIIGPYHPALLDRASLITDKGTDAYPIISFFIKEKTNYIFSSFIAQDSFEKAYMILDPCICLRSKKKELLFNSRSCQS